MDFPDMREGINRDAVAGRRLEPRFKWEQQATYQAFHSKVDLLNNLAVSSPRREYRLKLL